MASPSWVPQPVDFAAVRVRAEGGTTVGLTIAVPGPIDSAGVVRHAPALGWADVDLRAGLERALGAPGYPVAVETDAPAGRRRRTPDGLTLGLEGPDGTVTVLGTLDGQYLSTEVAGGFTGRVIGMYAAAGTVHFDWFDYRPLGGAAQADPGE